MEQYKNFYENQLLEAMMKSESSDSKLEDAQQKVIDDYMTIRFKTCMMNSSFAKKVKSPENGHVYLKVLQERIVDELGLTRAPELEDLQY